MARKLTCRRCGTALEAAATGRPARYCTTACRRAAEDALRRQKALLFRAEKALQDARLKVATRGGQYAQEAAWWAAEVERLEDYLLESLAFEDAQDAR